MASSSGRNTPPSWPSCTSSTQSASLACVAHLRAGALTRRRCRDVFPVQAAAGFARAVDDVVLARAPFAFPERYARVTRRVRTGIRTFETVPSHPASCSTRSLALLGFSASRRSRGRRRCGSSISRAGHWASRPIRSRSAAGESGLCSAARGRPRRSARWAGSIDQIGVAFHAGAAAALVAVSEFFMAESVVVSGGVFQKTRRWWHCSRPRSASDSGQPPRSAQRRRHRPGRSRAAAAEPPQRSVAPQTYRLGAIPVGP